MKQKFTPSQILFFCLKKKQTQTQTESLQNNWEHNPVYLPKIRTRIDGSQNLFVFNIFLGETTNEVKKHIATHSENPVLIE